MQDQLFNLKFSAKMLNRQAKKAQKDIRKEKLKLKKAIQQGNVEGARIYAENAIRYKNQSINYMKMASRIDAVAARVETAIRMNQVSRSMAGIVTGMDKAMKQMDLERLTMIMDKFSEQQEDVDVQTQYVEKAMGETTTLSTPADQVDGLIQQVADENGLELAEQLGFVQTPAKAVNTTEAVAEQDDLTARLAQLKG